MQEKKSLFFAYIPERVRFILYPVIYSPFIFLQQENVTRKQNPCNVQGFYREHIYILTLKYFVGVNIIKICFLVIENFLS